MSLLVVAEYLDVILDRQFNLNKYINATIYKIRYIRAALYPVLKKTAKYD